MPVEILAGMGIFAGCLARTVLPFLRKKAKAAETGPVKWENRYLWTAIFSVFVAAITTMMILPSFTLPAELVFPVGFVYGWTATDITNEVVK